MAWLRRGCLGLENWHVKTYDGVSADWALSAPFHLRRALLQGICDGDGFVALPSQQVCIATHSKQAFIQKLFSSFGIESTSQSDRVQVCRCDSILKLAELPMFRYARSRSESLDEVSRMIRARREKPLGSRLSHDEIHFASHLRKEGLSYGEITRVLFRQYGNSWDLSTVEHAVKRVLEREKG